MRRDPVDVIDLGQCDRLRRGRRPAKQTSAEIGTRTYKELQATEPGHRALAPSRSTPLAELSVGVGKIRRSASPRGVLWT
jgi:hypothetical protein